MLLTTDEFTLKAEEIATSPAGEVGCDLETTGLNPYKGDKAFVLGFTDTAGNKFSVKLDDSLAIKQSLHTLFSSPTIRYCAHNAKFECGFLSEQFGIHPPQEIWDTLVNARIEKNNHMSYALQACAERIGESKHRPMIAWTKIRGNKGMYHKAPLDLIIPYVEQDAWLSWKLRRHQVEVFKHWDNSSPVKIKAVINLEKAVLPHLFEMEKQGLLVDVGYCKRAIEYEEGNIRKAKADFERLAKVPFVDSRKTLKPIFDSHGIHYGETALGNASFTEENLAASKSNPVVGAILNHRRALKRLSSYWKNFIELEHNGIIHPSIHQNAAKTGRMSISDPSAQNWSTDEEEGTWFPIRRAFIARPDCVIASLDYSQMELRKSCDEAEDTPMIERILAGADLHQEIADMAKVARSLAKNGRFAKQYGAGVPRIASTLGVSLSVAKTISDAIDEQAKKTAAYSYHLSRTCKPFGYNWLGRRFYFDPGFEYKAFNYRIQGGCAEILKIAICEIGDFLKGHAVGDTFMLIPIHDEVVLNLDKRDLHLLPEIKRIMIAAQRDKKLLGMDVSVAVGPNFHDLKELEV